MKTLIVTHNADSPAIALANDLTLITHNTREFSRIDGLKYEDWK
ncbi:hypothetical protein [Nostoc sp. ChiSLP03a]